MSKDQLVDLKAEVSATGASAELRLHKETASLIPRLFPGLAAKRAARAIISDKILQKLGEGVPLDEADLEYAKGIFSDAEVKWARKQAVAQRAEQLLADGEFTRELPAPATEAVPPPATDPDWIDRFFEDAGVVSDEVLAELYARLLAAEARHPGESSKRTLGVLRDLDRHVADLFAKALSIHCGQAIPRSDELLREVGLDYSAILELDAAGLLDSAGNVATNIATDEPVMFTCAGHALLFVDAKGISLPSYPLTRAGRDLRRVADVTCEPETFRKVIDFIVGIVGSRNEVKFAYATLPNRRWQGPAGELQWVSVLPPDPPAADPG